MSVCSVTDLIRISLPRGKYWRICLSERAIRSGYFRQLLPSKVLNHAAHDEQQRAHDKTS
jgi:hypothetical protein